MSVSIDLIDVLEEARIILLLLGVVQSRRGGLDGTCLAPLFGVARVGLVVDLKRFSLVPFCDYLCDACEDAEALETRR